MNRALALLVAGCFFMENLDVTIVTTAAPRIAHELDVSPSSTGVLITTYLISLAVFIPFGGWLLTRLSARTIFASAVVVFTLMSLLCGLSSDFGELVVFRVLQGVGGALMVPVGRQLVLRDAQHSEIQRLIGYIVWPGLLAPVIAPLIGGLITTYADWQWIFFVNVPLGLLALPVAWRLVPRSTESPPRQFDRLGFILVGGGLGTLTWAGHQLAERVGLFDWLPWLSASLVLLVATVSHLPSASAPLIDVSVFRDRVFRISQITSVGVFAVVSAVPYLLPLTLQVAGHRSAIASGAIVMFIFVGNLGIKPATSALLNRFRYRPLLVGSSLGLALTTAALGLWPGNAPAAPLAATALLGGAFRSVSLTALTTVCFETITSAQRRAANTVTATISQVAAGLGVAFGAIGVSLGTAITGDASAHASFAWAFAMLSILGLIPVATAWMLPKRVGEKLLIGA